MVAFDPRKFHYIFNEFSFKVSVFFKKIGQYKVFEKVAVYRRFRDYQHH